MKKNSSSGEQVGNLEESHVLKENSSKPAIKEITNTPFATLQIDEKFHVIFGNSIISPKSYNSHEEASRSLHKLDYFTILNACTVLFNHLNSSK